MSPLRTCAAAWLLAGAVASLAHAQDSVAAPHVLPLDLSRAQPYARTYDMLVRQGDSTIVIGERRVEMQPATYAGAEAWLLAETRTGAVPSAETLYVSRDFHPLHWVSVVGPSRLATEFVGDTLLGAASVGRWKENIVAVSRPDMLVNGAQVEAILHMLPLAESWSDSASALRVDLSSTAILPATLTVAGSEDSQVDSVTTSAWLIEFRSSTSSVVYHLDKATGVPVLIQQLLPGATGSRLEFRLRTAPVLAPPGP